MKIGSRASLVFLAKQVTHCMKLRTVSGDVTQEQRPTRSSRPTLRIWEGVSWKKQSTCPQKRTKKTKKKSKQIKQIKIWQTLW